MPLVILFFHLVQHEQVRLDCVSTEQSTAPRYPILVIHLVQHEQVRLDEERRGERHAHAPAPRQG